MSSGGLEEKLVKGRQIGKMLILSFLMSDTGAVVVIFMR